MALEYIFVIALILWASIFVGFIIWEPVLLGLSAIGIMLLGVHIAINGFAGTNDLITQGFAIINIGFGVYVSLKTSLTIINEQFGGGSKV